MGYILIVTRANRRVPTDEAVDVLGWAHGRVFRTIEQLEEARDERIRANRGGPHFIIEMRKV